MRNRTWNIIPTCLTLVLAACGGILPSYETVAELSATVLNLDDTYF